MPAPKRQREVEFKPLERSRFFLDELKSDHVEEMDLVRPPSRATNPHTCDENFIKLNVDVFPENRSYNLKKGNDLAKKFTIFGQLF